MDVNIKKQKLETPENFQFPFTPYIIQVNFMKNLYELIENSKLGIFESPTGTGKSLSIICGALQWLKDHEIRERSELEETIKALNKEKNNVQTKSNDDWLSNQAEEIEITKKLQSIQLQSNKIKSYDEKIRKMKSKKRVVTESKWADKRDDEKSLEENRNENEDDEFLLDNIVDDSDEENADEVDRYEGTKIYICSRTHSQLAQLVHEVERSAFAEDVRLITLASRQNYCINPAVSKLNNVALINERCLDMQKKETKTTKTDSDGKTIKKKRNDTCKCPYMQAQQIEELKNSALLDIQDVEELVKNGKKMNACPYYSARSAVEDARIVVLPYNLILHKSTREASGIKLKNNIVIIDEAHNLLEALTEMYSALVTGHQLIHAYNQLTEYRNRYRSRFSAVNLLNINQILFIVGKLIKMLGGKAGCSTSETIRDTATKLFTFEDFISEADIDNLNIHKLLKFCLNSKICNKLHGFSAKYQQSVSIHQTKKEETGVSAFLKEISNKNKQLEPLQETEEKDIQDMPRNPMLAVVAFLETLTNRCEDGRVVCSKQSTVGKGYLKFLLLNPSSHFKSVVSEARAILVAGGTMQPMSEFRNRLFVSSGATEDRIMEFSCDHIVPPENILPIILSSGPSGHQLEFSFGSRNASDTLNELGSILQNICMIVPSGVVCFFPSYDYEKIVYNHLEKSQILKQISNKKQIFREPKSSSDVDKTLSSYAKAIKHSSGTKTGAILFSVVGGKLSEGLNFSDALGRCVIVVGMPYPNIKSPELQEKMSYLNKYEGAGSGNAYYESVCMKAVNQCIGRAVRHKNDYACVLLLDRRYSRPKTQQALPKWIQRSLVSHEKFGQAFGNIKKFFTSKNENQQK